MNASVSRQPTPAIYRSGLGYRALLNWYETELPKTTIPYESRMLQTGFGDTHVLVMGPQDAPPLLLFHGLNINALAMRRFWMHLSTRFRVYAPDVIGEPGRSTAFRPKRTGHGYAEWAVELMDALELPKAHVMGVSFGGWLTLKLGRYAPERIDKGVLFVPAGIAPVRMKAKIHFARRAVPFILSPNESRFLKLVTPLFSPDATPDQDLLDVMRICFRYVKTDPAPFAPMSREELSVLTSPMLMMSGEHDLFYHHHEHLEMARKALPQGSLVESMPGQGHIFFNPALKDTCERIMRFLEEGV